MEKQNKILYIWKQVFTNPSYLILTLIVAFFFYFANGLILNLTDINSSYHALGLPQNSKLLFTLSLNFASQVAPFTTVTTIVLGILIGALISLLAYRFKKIKTREMEKVGALGTIGIFLGAAAPGCAACGVGLLGLLGLSSALALLPFQGREVSVLAIGLIAFSIYDVSGKIYNPACKLKIDKNVQKPERGQKLNGKKYRRRNKN